MAPGLSQFLSGGSSVIDDLISKPGSRSVGEPRPLTPVPLCAEGGVMIHLNAELRAVPSAFNPQHRDRLDRLGLPSDLTLSR